MIKIVRLGGERRHDKTNYSKILRVAIPLLPICLHILIEHVMILEIVNVNLSRETLISFKCTRNLKLEGFL